MKRDLSAYLDLLRVAAATIVFLSHLSWDKVSGGFLWQLQPLSHSAVVLFFVLSGFVIQYTVDQKERTLKEYASARLARLYSVVVPAIILTFICDFIGTQVNPSVYHMERETMPVARMALGAIFLTQSWQKVSLLSNDPFWSLPYEFWYYVIFAAAVFFSGWRRIVVVGLGSFIAGPAILIMFPIWIFGAVTYRASKRLKLTPSSAWMIWLTSGLATIVAISQNGQPTVPTTVYLPTAISPLDYAIGAGLSVNILAATQLHLGLEKFQISIAYIAGMTFALYLFHLPLLHLASAYMPQTLPVLARGLIAATFALAVIYALSFVTEGQKHRWRDFFRRLLGLYNARKLTTING